ncbi:MAG: hypothetical protein IJC94_03895 [Oscillospiraceae bacterium]|nr:hypothetical protein [Oscillospiraceae bacterium]
MKKIQQCLNGQHSTNHILPFFWQHGEEHHILTEEIEAIQNCGLTEFCVESRTHMQFGEEKWWEDFGFILEEAKKRNMRVWLLDDKRFPTGYSNNYIASHPELRKISLRYVYRDFAGPQNGTALLPPLLDADDEEQFISIAAFKRTKEGNILEGDGIQLIQNLKDGLIWWDIPEGIWRVCYVIRTRHASNERKANYLDVMSPESSKAILKAVYEPHYEHFSEYFGNTFVGFFSDEPSFANDTANYYSHLGKEEMLVPWNDDIPAILAEKAGRSKEEMLALLPALWHEIEGRTSLVRETYMEAATEAYSKNFCSMLGDWCRERNVMYVGHIIEDMNAHQRLGAGGGHFFRALDGQDMAGIDIVLHQIIPGHPDLSHAARLDSPTADPAFFRYTLPKLGASHAHIQPLKKGRAMCEIFGAFGWATGIPAMKYMSDLMLVCGINHFVPHAFTPKYPDPDCPPHFYARGNNHQFKLFGQLMGYMQRVTHALTDGIHQADVAVYYNAEAEWSGGKNMLQQEVCKVLTRRQIDFDIIPQDTVCTAASVAEGKLLVNDESYSALVVPYSQYLPEKVIAAIGALADSGLTVLFADALPDCTSEQRPLGDTLANCSAVPLCELTALLEKQNIRGITPACDTPFLRFYHINRNGTDMFMLWNEDIFSEIDTQITFPAEGCASFYDAWNNRRYAAAQKGSTVRIRLAPSESIILTFSGSCDELAEFDYRDTALTALELDWKVSLRTEKETEFTPLPNAALDNLAPSLPNFSGVIRYEAVLDLENADDISVLALGNIGETAELTLNGEYCGSVVCKPYRFDVGGKLKKGKNTLCIDVCANLAYRERDKFSTYIPLPPMGLMGPISIG